MFILNGKCVISSQSPFIWKRISLFMYRVKLSLKIEAVVENKMSSLQCYDFWASSFSSVHLVSDMIVRHIAM